MVYIWGDNKTKYAYPSEVFAIEFPTAGEEDSSGRHV